MFVRSLQQILTNGSSSQKLADATDKKSYLTNYTQAGFIRPQHTLTYHTRLY